jgi:ribosomal protein L21E
VIGYKSQTLSNGQKFVVKFNHEDNTTIEYDRYNGLNGRIVSLTDDPAIVTVVFENSIGLYHMFVRDLEVEDI